jgi:hypothetical protein
LPTGFPCPQAELWEDEGAAGQGSEEHRRLGVQRSLEEHRSPEAEARVGAVPAGTVLSEERAWWEASDRKRLVGG